MGVRTNGRTTSYWKADYLLDTKPLEKGLEKKCARRPENVRSLDTLPTGSSLHNFNVIFWLAAIPGILAALSIVALVSERAHPVLKDASVLGGLQAAPAVLPAVFGRRLRLRMR